MNKKNFDTQRNPQREKEIDALERKLGFDGRPYDPPYECAVVGPTNGHAAPGIYDEMIASGKWKIVNGKMEQVEE